MCSRVRSLIIGVRVDCFTVCKTPLSGIFDRLRNRTVVFIPHLCGNRGSEGREAGTWGLNLTLES